MSSGDNTLFLRLAGVMQSWGTSSSLQIRRTDLYPSKSGILGLLLCARGVRREDSRKELEPLNKLLMGVRVDRPGTPGWDYHTAGAKIGIRRADGKGLKYIPNTKEYEPQLSRRQYLYDASFLVALQGDEDTVSTCARALGDPVWPLFLGRKCCVPGEPVLVGTGGFDSLHDVLSSVPWQPRMRSIDNRDYSATRILDIYLEQPPESGIPQGARLVYDAPVVLGFWSHAPRWVIKGVVTVPVGDELQRPMPRPYVHRFDYASESWKEARTRQLEEDSYLCVFCKSPATEVHHVTYEEPAVLRSLCDLCHDACTQLEYGHGRTQRVDPCDPGQRQTIADQIARLLKERRSGRRRELLRSARLYGEG